MVFQHRPVETMCSGWARKMEFHVQCDLRYINHSDEPNAVYFDTLEVCALTDIAPGEEITHDYTDGQ